MQLVETRLNAEKKKLGTGNKESSAWQNLEVESKRCCSEERQKQTETGLLPVCGEENYGQSEWLVESGPAGRTERQVEIERSGFLSEAN